MSVDLSRHSEAGMQSTTAAFRTSPQTLCSMDDDADFVEMQRDLASQLDRFTNQGSGWSLDSVSSFIVNISLYRPLSPGSSYIESPVFIKNKRAVVNVENNNDNECFKWAVLSALYPSSGDPRTLKQYKKFEHKFNWTGLRFPLPLNQIRRFENNNQSLTVNVYIYKPEEGDGIIPVYLTKHQVRSRHIDLLLLSDGPNTHYTCSRNMSALVAHTSTLHHKSFTCPHCVHKFTTKVAFENHFPDCSKHERQVIKFPELGKHILEWRSRNKTQLTSHIIYADFESYLFPITHTDPPTSKTTVIDEHIPSGFCCYTVSQSPHYPNRLVSYSGENCMDHFFDHLMSEQTGSGKACIEGKNIEMLPLTRHPILVNSIESIKFF